MNFLQRRAQSRKPMQPPKESGPIRCAAHLKHVRGFNCVCAEIDPTGCGGKIEAAHVRRGTDGGIAMKPGDNWTYPACSNHHAEQHRVGEQTFEKTYRFSLKQIAERLWARSPHGQKYRFDQQRAQSPSRTQSR